MVLAYFFQRAAILQIPMLFLLLREESVVENQQIDNRARDISIGEVENRSEEVVVVIYQE